MKSHPSPPAPSERKPSSSVQAEAARPGPARDKPPEYKVEVSYYSTMKPRRVYPLVVEVPRGKGALAVDAPTGIVVALRPVVPGALVAPAELPLEVSRPGARATFHVTPLARGGLPGAGVRVFYDGRPVQELATPMRVKTQRPAWVLLFLALAVPALLCYLRYRPVDGLTVQQQLRDLLRVNLPAFSGSDRVFDGIALAVGLVSETLCGTDADPRAAFWVGVALLVLACGAAVLRRTERDRERGSVVLTGGPSALTLHGDQTAETLPLAPD
jgi:hypothetical protein